jgi:hypothetical protein
MSQEQSKLWRVRAEIHAKRHVTETVELRARSELEAIKLATARVREGNPDLVEILDLSAELVADREPS